MNERVGADIGHAELGVLGRRGIAIADALRGVFGHAGLDRRDVGETAAEHVAQLERRFDRGMRKAAARIELWPEPALHQLEAAAEIVERIGFPIEAAQEGAEEAVAALDRR